MRSAHVFDDLDEFVEAVAVVAGELDQLLCPLDDDAAFGRPCNRDTAPASELELVLDRSALVANAAECVGLTAPGRSFAGGSRSPAIALHGHSPANLACDLHIEVGGSA